MSDDRGRGERRLEGGSQTEVHESGGVVYRSSGPQSHAVLALLRHLDDVDFAESPQVVGTGFALDGRETLAFVEGESLQPRPWSDEAIAEVGAILRRLHCATASFDPTDPPRWRPWFARSLPGRQPVIGHGDLGPWNILAREGRPAALIDWDNAGPVDATWALDFKVVIHQAW